MISPGVSMIAASQQGASFCGKKKKKSFHGGSYGKESACSAGELGLIAGGEDPLEKRMATHSSILAWQIPWTEEHGGLESTGLQRIRHN